MIYDITQELFSGAVYPGDMAPQFRRVRSREKGDRTNATEYAANAHNATHIDAPIHKLDGGKAIDELPLDACVGECEVISVDNTERLKSTDAVRVLLKGCESLNAETAQMLVDRKIRFVGVEGQSIGTNEVHCILLGAEVIVLEGAVLREVPEGRYHLIALPIKLGGCDGAPCRAVLIKE